MSPSTLKRRLVINAHWLVVAMDAMAMLWLVFQPVPTIVTAVVAVMLAVNAYTAWFFYRLLLESAKRFAMVSLILRSMASQCECEACQELSEGL